MGALYCGRGWEVRDDGKTAGFGARTASWGNWNGYVGTRRVIEFGLDWRAASPVRPATALDKTAGT